MQLSCFETKLPNLMLKTRPKQLLGSLPLDTALPGKAQYGSPPDTNLSGSAPFYIENTIYLVAKSDTLIRRSTVLSLPPQVVFPAVINSLPWCTQLLACNIEPT
jgi:hypothetical protein